MTMPHPIRDTKMDAASVVAAIVKLVVTNTTRPIEGVGILCSSVALIWLNSEHEAGVPDDAVMAEEFKKNLIDCVRLMREDIEASEHVH